MDLVWFLEVELIKYFEGFDVRLVRENQNPRPTFPESQKWMGTEKTQKGTHLGTDPQVCPCSVGKAFGMHGWK